MGHSLVLHQSSRNNTYSYFSCTHTWFVFFENYGFLLMFNTITTKVNKLYTSNIFLIRDSIWRLFWSFQKNKFNATVMTNKCLACIRFWKWYRTFFFAQDNADNWKRCSFCRWYSPHFGVLQFILSYNISENALTKVHHFPSWEMCFEQFIRHCFVGSWKSEKVFWTC